MDPAKMSGTLGSVISGPILTYLPIYLSIYVLIELLSKINIMKV